MQASPSPTCFAPTYARSGQKSVADGVTDGPPFPIVDNLFELFQILSMTRCQHKLERHVHASPPRSLVVPRPLRVRRGFRV